VQAITSSESGSPDNEPSSSAAAAVSLPAAALQSEGSCSSQVHVATLCDLRSQVDSLSQLNTALQQEVKDLKWSRDVLYRQWKVPTMEMLSNMSPALPSYRITHCLSLCRAI